MFVKSLLSKCKDTWIEHGSKLCYGCKQSIGRSGVKFSLSGTPVPHFVLDVDNIDCLRAVRHCDYVFVAGDGESKVMWVTPIELTSSARKEPKIILEQIQNIVDAIEKHVDVSTEVKLRPVLMGDYNRKRMREGSKNFAVRFRGKKISVAVIKKGASIAEALHH